MNGTPATLNFNRMFPRGWPKTNVYNGDPETKYSKTLKAAAIRGVNKLPGAYSLNQGKQSVNKNRVYRNANINTLSPGVYLYLIEYEPSSRKYFKQFVKVQDKAELGSKHFMLPTHEGDRVVLAAGELLKSEEGKIFWNIQSGTFMSNFIEQAGGNSSKFKVIVLNAFRNTTTTLEFHKNYLIPNVPVKLGNLIKSLEAGKAEVNPLTYRSPNFLRWAKNEHARRAEQGLTTVNNKGNNKPVAAGNTPQSKVRRKNNGEKK
jgi:hypothetical protein